MSVVAATPQRDGWVGRSAVAALLLIAGAAHAAEWALRSQSPGTLAIAAIYLALGVWLRRGGAAALLLAAIVPMLGGLGGARELAREFDWPLAGFVALDVAIVGLCLYRLVTGELLAAERLMKTFREPRPGAPPVRRSRPPPHSITTQTHVLLVFAWLTTAVGWALAYRVPLAKWYWLTGPAAMAAIPCGVLALAASHVGDTRWARGTILLAALLVCLAPGVAVLAFGAAAHTEALGLAWFAVGLAQCLLLMPFVLLALAIRMHRQDRIDRGERPL